MDIYWERQQGDNCRIHSLNAMFGKQNITIDLFKADCAEYDNLITGLTSINMDGFAECRSIISYIVDKYTKRFTLLIPINLNGVSANNRAFFNYKRYIPHLGSGVTEYFEFNKGHIWFNKNINGTWYKIDSLSGVTASNKPSDFNNNGFLLVFDKNMIYIELEYIIEFIKNNIVVKNKNNKNNKNNIDDNCESLFYNLFHLIKLIKLEYDSNNSEFNKKISTLRQLFKTVTNFIKENRKLHLDPSNISRIRDEILELIILF